MYPSTADDPLYRYIPLLLLLISSLLLLIPSTASADPLYRCIFSTVDDPLYRCIPLLLLLILYCVVDPLLLIAAGPLLLIAGLLLLLLTPRYSSAIFALASSTASSQSCYSIH